MGDTVQLAATLTDRRGTTLVGAPVAWSSDEPGIAEVDARGRVVARAGGTAMIVAAAGVHMARANIVVMPRAVRVRLAADSGLRVGEGTTRAIDAHGVDRHGYSIVGRRVSWRVADTTIATVDSMGGVTGRSVGRTMITASVDDVGDSAPLEVVAVPASIALVTGAVLRAPAGSRVPQALVVRVLSARGAPAAGMVVRFEAPPEMGTLDPVEVKSDAGGLARSTWVLGPMPGRQHLTVSAVGLDSTLTLTAEADPVAANMRYERQDGATVGRVGEPLSEPINVRLTDSLGRSLADVPVAWLALDGGVVTPDGSRTDSLGEAHARWTLGPQRGTQRLRVQAGNARLAPPLTVTATANAGKAERLVVISGDKQTGRVDAVLDASIRLRAVDASGNPVSGARVMATPESGSTPDTATATDSSGVTRIHWRLGRAAGPQHLRLRVEGIAHAVGISAVARPGQATNLELTAPPASGVVGRPLGHPITARATDAYGNAVPDVPILFAPRSGRAAPRLRMTDAQGRASTQWTLGASSGEQSLAIAVPHTDARTVLTIVANSSRGSSQKSNR
ncbi:MAG TPA: Ig-like domain-containing protein [Gemmatimonadaceae bacterium]|nr:Ig-like domain-containing protein [Gemmatimonadaceae bacterium]